LSRLFRSKEFPDDYAKWFGKPNTSVATFYEFVALPE
jgi:hypothetical protein